MENSLNFWDTIINIVQYRLMYNNIITGYYSISVSFCTRTWTVLLIIISNYTVRYFIFSVQSGVKYYAIRFLLSPRPFSLTF